MLSGKPPFWGNQREHLRKARAEQYPLNTHPWDQISDNAKDFIRRLLKANPMERLPIEKVAEHPWLTRPELLSNCREITQVLTNLKQFSNTSRFEALCVAAVARQLDHRYLRRIHRVFREMDTNGDGVLTFEEVAEGFKKMFGERSVDYEEVRATFDQLDLDGSGTIDYTEFCAAGLGQYATLQDDAVWAAFKSFDIDDSGALTRENMEKVLSDAGVLQAWSPEVCTEVAQEVMNRFDSDGSGAIEYSEWKEIMRMCWEDHTMESKQEDAGQINLLRELSTRSTRSTSTNYCNNTVAAYSVLSAVNGLAPTDDD